MRIVKIVLILFAAALTGVAGVAWTWYRTPLTLPSAPYDFEVRSGATLSAVARALHQAGVLPHPLALVALARWRGVDRTMKAGSYEIDAGITLPQLLAKLTQGDVTQTALTIVEGATFA
ncbi:MAG: endolytic transglycosylase MltG, partial [Casimicrobiaceae bacterium]